MRGELVDMVNLKETPDPFYILREFLVHKGGGEEGRSVLRRDWFSMSP